jgi:hypothetical protein
LQGLENPGGRELRAHAAFHSDDSTLAAELARRSHTAPPLSAPGAPPLPATIAYVGALLFSGGALSWALAAWLR